MSKWVVAVRDVDESGELYGSPRGGQPAEERAAAFGSFVTPPLTRKKADREALFIAIRAWHHYEDRSDGELIGVAAMLAASANITPGNDPTAFYNLPTSVQRQGKEKRQFYWLLDALKTHTGVEIEVLPVGAKNALR